MENDTPDAGDIVKRVDHEGGVITYAKPVPCGKRKQCDGLVVHCDRAMGHDGPHSGGDAIARLTWGPA